MLKKLGIVSLGVTAGLMSAAPSASASESCNVTSDGNNIGVHRCSTVGEGNGVGNTFNDVELPGLPALPPLPELPDTNGIASGVPKQFEFPGIPA